MQYPNECETALRVFCSELTKEINILEHKKYEDKVDAATILNLEKQTSRRYLFLAHILHKHPKLEQECILTSFSMNPTHECFEFVCELAERNQASTFENTMSHNNNSTASFQIPPTTSLSPSPLPLPLPLPSTETASQLNESIDALHSITSANVLLNSKNYDALRAPNRLLDSLTDLSDGARSDLVCLLTMPRMKNLSWLIPWPELKRECQELLMEENKRQIVEKTTAKANDNLKYINLNYDDFKDFTPHEYPGIETGYEIYMADSDSDESLIHAYASDNDGGDSTDTAPESKQFIVKEARRLKYRKRMLIRRGKQLLEQSENSLKIKIEDDGNDSDQIRKRRKKNYTTGHIDSLKPVKRRGPSKKQQKSGDENSRGEVTIANGNLYSQNVDIKPEPIEIKEEPTYNEDDYVFNFEPKIPLDANDIKLMQCNDSGDDMSRTFADLSNVQPFNGVHFPVLPEHFDSVNAKECDDFTAMDKENNFTDQTNDSLYQAIQAKPLVDTANEFIHLPPFDTSSQFEQLETLVSTNTIHTSTESSTSSTTMFSKELVNSIILGEQKIEPNDDQILATICNGQFNSISGDGDDAKIGIPFPNLVGEVSDIFNFNTELPNFTDETINSLQPVPVTQTQMDQQHPQLQPLPPQQQQSNETENIVAQLTSGKSLDVVNTVPYVTNNENFGNGINAISKVQNSKSKNPLLAFRKPKKLTVATSTEVVPLHSQNGQQQQPQPHNSIISVPSLSEIHPNPNVMHTTDTMKLNTVFTHANNIDVSTNRFIGHRNYLNTCNVDLQNDQVGI